MSAKNLLETEHNTQVGLVDTSLPIDKWVRRLKQTAMSPDARRGVLCLADQAIVSAANFFTSVILGRACFQQELGLYAVGFSIVAMLTSIPQALVWAPYTVYSPRLRGKKLADFTGSTTVQMLAVCLLAAIGTAGAGAIAGVVSPGSKLAALLGVLPVAAAFILFRQFVRRTALARMNMGQVLILDAVVSVLQIGGLGLLASFGLLSANTTYVVITFACGVAAVMWTLSMRKSIRVRTQRIWPDFSHNWRFARWMMCSAVVRAINDGSYTWLLGIFHGTAVVGVFYAAVGITSLINPLLIGIGNFYGPFASHTVAHSGTHRLWQIITWSTCGLAVLVAPVCAFVAIWGGDLVEFLYGPEFAGQGPLVRALAVCFLLEAVSIPIGFGLIVRERTDYGFKSQLLQLGITLTLGAWWMYHLGPIGAIYGSIVGRSSMIAFQWFGFAKVSRDG